MAAALERFGIDIAMTRGGWDLALDAIYDQINDQLQQIHATLVGAMRIGASR